MSRRTFPEQGTMSMPNITHLIKNANHVLQLQIEKGECKNITPLLKGTEID
jgi:hypothetical protein